MVGCSTNFSSLKTTGDNGYEIIVTKERTILNLAYKAITQQFPMDNISKMSGEDLGYTWTHQPLIDKTNFKFIIEKHLGEIANGNKVEGFSYQILTSGTRMFEESLNVNPLIDKFESLLKQRQIEKIMAVNIKPVTNQGNIKDGSGNEPEEEWAATDWGVTQAKPNNTNKLTTSKTWTEPLVNHALVIGINDYHKLTKLNSAVSDAQAVSNILESDYGYSVTTLLNPKRVDIINAITDYRKKLTSNDALLIYYAGHGWLDKEADEGYWLPADATQDSETNWIPTSSTITASLRAMEARHVMVVADSCYSGKLTRGLNVVPKSPSEVSRLQQKKSRKILASGGLEPVADNNSKDKHSVFASAFLKALRENDQVLTATELFSTVRASVIRNADQTPEYGVIHKAGDDGGDFVFVKKR